MPTVLRIDGGRVVIYPNDHRPAHVHVLSAGRQAIFHLNCPSGPVHLRTVRGYGRSETNRLAKALDQAVRQLCSAWEDIHGDR